MRVRKPGQLEVGLVETDHFDHLGGGPYARHHLA